MQRPFQERFVISGLGVARINLSTKFEISTFTHYKKATKMQKLRWFEG